MFEVSLLEAMSSFVVLIAETELVLDLLECIVYTWDYVRHFHVSSAKSHFTRADVLWMIITALLRFDLVQSTCSTNSVRRSANVQSSHHSPQNPPGGPPYCL